MKSEFLFLTGEFKYGPKKCEIIMGNIHGESGQNYCYARVNPHYELGMDKIDEVIFLARHYENSEINPFDIKNESELIVDVFRILNPDKLKFDNKMIFKKGDLRKIDRGKISRK